MTARNCKKSQKIAENRKISQNMYLPIPLEVGGVAAYGFPAWLVLLRSGSIGNIPAVWPFSLLECSSGHSVCVLLDSDSFPD